MKSLFIYILLISIFVLVKCDDTDTLYQKSTKFYIQKSNLKCPLSEYGIIEYKIIDTWLFKYHKTIASVAYYPCAGNQNRRSAVIKMYMLYATNQMFIGALKSIINKNNVGFTEDQVKQLSGFIGLIKSSLWYQQKIILQQENRNVVIKHLDKHGNVVTVTDENGKEVKMEFSIQIDLDLIDKFYRAFRLEYTMEQKI